LSDLGPVSVSIDGARSGASITQPRLIALLAYLVVARPRGQHSRDTLIALLWPDSDQASGRQALRNALHRLRAAVGENAILSIGESFVVLAPGAFISDSLAFEDAVSAGRWGDAIASYRGPFLKGFHVDGAPEFAQWLDEERARLTSMAVQAAAAEAQDRRAKGDLPGAIAAARFACALAPDDERVFRQLLELLVAAGDHATARRAYDGFAHRLRAEYDVAPAPETAALIQKVRHSTSTPTDSRQAFAFPAGLALAPGSAPSEPVTKRHHRRVVTAGVLGVVLIAGITIWRISNPPPAPGDTVASADLQRRWRTDTALLARYLRGKTQMATGRVALARETFTLLTQEAPFYGPAWAGLSYASLRSGTVDIPPSQAMTAAMEAVQRAMDRDSSLVMAHQTLIAVDMFGRWDLAGAKARLEVALKLHPDDPELLNLLATWHLWRGEFDELLMLKRANSEHEPLSSRYVFQVLPSLFFARHYSEAVNTYRRLPPEIRISVVEGAVVPALLCAGLRDEAASAIREAAVAAGDTVIARLFVESPSPAARDRAMESAFRVHLERLHEKRRIRWIPPERFMFYYALRKHPDSTLAWLDSMQVDRSMWLHVVPFDPLMDFLRADPRFDSVLTRLTWLPSLGVPMQRMIDSLRAVAASR
jgi:DNA-binding SARP family transcriptional activator